MKTDSKNNPFLPPDWLKINFYPDIREFEPIPLPNKDGQLNTRKVVKARFINPNPRNPNAPLEISISHQKKKSTGDYEECQHFPLSQLKAGQEIRMILDTEQTLALKAILDGWYDYCEKNLGISLGPIPAFSLEKTGETVKVSPDKKTIIEGIISENNEDEFWEELAKLKPNSATKLSYARIFSIRNEALEIFKVHIDKLDWTELEWQEFFEENTWIFGYGLCFKWMLPVGKKLEQTTTGSSITSAGKRPDAFIKTVAEVGSTVFVDVKRPDTVLLEELEYRPAVYRVSREVSGGVSQVQVTIDGWLSDSRNKILSPENAEGYPATDPIFSYQPKGILVIGTLAQFKKEGEYHQRRIASFELFRRQLSNPEIITFDELYHRAKHIVMQAEEKG